MKTGLALVALFLTAGCASSSASSERAAEHDLTSLTARERKLSFEGVVYVDPVRANDDAFVIEAVRRQTKSAFGALLHSEITVQSRGLADIDARTFTRRTVSVLGNAARELVEVRYEYSDKAIVAVNATHRSTLPLALLARGGEGHEEEVITSCTTNDESARHDLARGHLWYPFNPSRARCKELIAREERKIAEDEALLPRDGDNVVSSTRVDRVYQPIAVRLAPGNNAERATYPEYDRLFGKENNTLTIALVEGLLAEVDGVELRNDSGYLEWLSTLEVLFEKHPDFKLATIEPANIDITHVEVNGRTYDNLSFADFIRWTVYGSGWPQGMPPGDRDDITRAISERLHQHWLTFEKKVMVSNALDQERPVTIRFETYFGALADPAPYKRAIQRGDVVVYNGHTFTGEGPLDARHYDASSFRDGYQIFFIDSCISYHFYEKGFLNLKPGGTKELDFIANGLEAPQWHSGEAQGRLLSKLISGKNPSYRALLQEARDSDAHRVVDGDLDNTFDPRENVLRIR